jgi:hypothetical protein
MGRAGAFLPFLAVCAFAFAAVFMWLPETKHKTLEQIQKDFDLDFYRDRQHGHGGDGGGGDDHEGGCAREALLAPEKK